MAMGQYLLHVDAPRGATPTPSTSNTKLDKIYSTPEQLVLALSRAQQKDVRACQQCMVTTHVTNECLELEIDEVKILGHNQGNGYQKYHPNSLFYNPGWKDRDNLKYGT